MKVYKNRKAGEKILETYDMLLKEWGCEFTEIDLQTEYGTTHVIVSGKEDGEPMVLFHGVGDDSALMWIFNAKALGEKYRLYAVDLLGGPGKSRPNENYKKKYDEVKWIDEVLSGLDLEKAMFAGVSMGGYLVQLYALRRPEKVIKAISISGAVHAGTKKNGAKTLLKIFLPEALFPTDKNVIKLLKKLSGKNYAVFTENKLILEHYKYLLRGFNNMAMNPHHVSDGFSSEEIDRIRDKVVFLVGDEDPFEKLGGKQLLIDLKMNATFYPDAGHGLNHELAEEINKKIIEVMASTSNSNPYT